MSESTQHRLDRVRPPRVQITYDVEIGNAIEMKEIPFVVGIIGDLSGHPADPLPKLKERKFVEIDRDNFEHIMESLNPRLTLRVKNTVHPEDEHLSCELFFKKMDDFTPLNVTKQIPTLNTLFTLRSHLKDLLTKLDGNDELEHILNTVLSDAGQLHKLKIVLGMIPPDPPPAGDGGSPEQPKPSA